MFDRMNPMYDHYLDMWHPLEKVRGLLQYFHTAHMAILNLAYGVSAGRRRQVSCIVHTRTPMGLIR